MIVYDYLNIPTTKVEAVTFKRIEEEQKWALNISYL